MSNFPEDEKRIVVHIRDGKAEVVNNPDDVRVHVINFDNEIVNTFLEGDLGSKEKTFRCCYCLKYSPEYDWSVATITKKFMSEPLSKAISSYENSESIEDIPKSSYYNCPLCFEDNDHINIAEGAKYRGNGIWK